ncbi:hypothetical protein [Paraburkholderia tropica]|uniref:hypothetical protein n=1 Tax=Paraburkholderia tropica TaxID=92647 RepID=UPI002AB76BEC|nr:hypothetical protein [Paraburkholderia tropica]
MNETLQNICTELEQVIAQLSSSLPSDQPFGLTQGNWSFPNLSRAELIAEAKSIIELIKDRGGEELGENADLIKDYPRRLQFLRSSTIPNLWANAASGVPAYQATLAGLASALSTALTNDGATDAALAIRRLTQQVRAMEARLRDLAPRSEMLSNMLERIEHAYEAADRLPTDLEALGEARAQLHQLVNESEKDHLRVSALRDSAEDITEKLDNASQEAAATLARCETAYSAATSQGLAAAFAKRSKALDYSMWAWVGGLVLALVVSGTIGSRQLHSFTEVLREPTASGTIVALNLILSVIAVGAPVWFAWLATKQIGQRFRLAEDYAFKASISQAYEGYRREAARIDKDLEVSLLASALNRLDELPLRLVEPVTHGSPLHELAHSPVVRDALRLVPGFATNVVDVARESLEKLRPPVSVPVEETKVIKPVNAAE